MKLKECIKYLVYRINYIYKKSYKNLKFYFKINLKKKSEIKIHFGPGPGWEKPDDSWIAIDCDASRGDFIADLNKIEKLPFLDNSVECIYASHTFEHVSIYNSDMLFKECYRVLREGGIIRIIIPDVVTSMNEYFNENFEFPLFKKRKENLEYTFGKKNATIFDCLRGDFISMTYQMHSLGEKKLAHQNCWDYLSLKNDLENAGFKQVEKVGFRESKSNFFNFEGTYESEANETYRSLYVEAIK